MQNLSDRALKERIIGAVVLVVFVVLVVPVFLDGGANEPDRIRETVTLPGQNEQERKQQTIVLERDRSEPVPVTQRSPAAVPEPSDEPAVEAPASNSTLALPAIDDAAPQDSSPQTVEQPAEDTTPPVADEPMSSTGMWAVQLGSFSNQENAERLAAELRAAGFAAFLSRLSTDTGSLHRVRIGPQKDRESAEKIARQIGADGYSGQVVPHP